VLIVAKRNILSLWKNEDVPSFKTWLSETTKSSLEGSTVTLSCKYSKTVAATDDFFWYRKHSEKPPEFLIFHYGTQNVTAAGLFVTVSDDKNHIIMKISSAAVSDSAVYYYGPASFQCDLILSNNDMKNCR
uniref:Ig-like domain-containing protein n=1 Tax=Amphiprion percula TaxID=161767 RepID=A0A3P8SQK6_AMPPE